MDIRTSHMISETTNAMAEYVLGRIWLKDYPIRFAGCRFNALQARDAGWPIEKLAEHHHTM